MFKERWDANGKRIKSRGTKTRKTRRELNMCDSAENLGQWRNEKPNERLERGRQTCTNVWPKTQTTCWLGFLGAARRASSRCRAASSRAG